MSERHVTLELTNTDGRPYGQGSSLTIVVDALSRYEEYLEKRIENLHKSIRRSVVRGGHGRSHTALGEARQELGQTRKLLKQVREQ